MFASFFNSVFQMAFGSPNSSLEINLGVTTNLQEHLRTVLMILKICVKVCG